MFLNYVSLWIFDWMIFMLKTRGERLKAARMAAGFKSSKGAAEALGINYATFNAHERAEAPGGRDYGPGEAKKYARRFKVEDIWLLTGKGKGPKGLEDSEVHLESSDVAASLDDGIATSNTVPIVGYVGAGAEAHFYAVAQGNLDVAPAPMDATPSSVAVEIRGTSIGAMFDRWLVYYDDVRSPVTTDLIGRLCVVGTADGRILVKKIKRAKLPGTYDLISETEPAIEGVSIDWAARVKQLSPQ